MVAPWSKDPAIIEEWGRLVVAWIEGGDKWSWQSIADIKLISDDISVK